MSSTNSDVLVPSSLETFASNVDKEIDDEEEDDEKSAADGFGKKVVIKLDDSDIEETRGNLWFICIQVETNTDSYPLVPLNFKALILF